MIALRIFAIVITIVLAVAFGVYLISGDKRYLQFSRQVCKFAFILALVYMSLWAIGRVVLL